MDGDWYINECLRQLNDTSFYRPLDNDITDGIQKRVNVYTQRMLRDNIVDKNTKRFLTQPSPKPGRFYILPKIHKQRNSRRPIVSSNGHPTEHLSQFVDYYLQPLVKTTNSFIKDTQFSDSTQAIGTPP